MKKKGQLETVQKALKPTCKKCGQVKVSDGLVGCKECNARSKPMGLRV